MTTLDIPLEEKPSKSIKDFPNTICILHFPTKNRAVTRQGHISLQS
jgi:hypothetical protein